MRKERFHHGDWVASIGLFPVTLDRQDDGRVEATAKWRGAHDLETTRATIDGEDWKATGADAARAVIEDRHDLIAYLVTCGYDAEWNDPDTEDLSDLSDAD